LGRSYWKTKDQSWDSKSSEALNLNATAFPEQIEAIQQVLFESLSENLTLVHLMETHSYITHSSATIGASPILAFCDSASPPAEANFADSGHSTPPHPATANSCDSTLLQSAQGHFSPNEEMAPGSLVPTHRRRMIDAVLC
jgi:hypothetical protein